MTPLSAVSRETVFATGCIGVLVGSATGVLFPTFWRFVSDAILMQDSPTGNTQKLLYAGFAVRCSHGRADGRTLSSNPIWQQAQRVRRKWRPSKKMLYELKEINKD